MRVLYVGRTIALSGNKAEAARREAFSTKYCTAVHGCKILMILFRQDAAMLVIQYVGNDPFGTPR